MKSTNKNINVNKVVNVFSSTYILGSIGNSIINNVFILFMASVKGFSDGEISIILGILPLISIFTFFVWGAIIDKYKKLVFFNKLVYSMNIVTLFLLYRVDDFKLFFIINLIRTIMMQPSGVANDEYLLNLSNKYGVRFGRIRVFGTIGYGIAGIVSTISLAYIGINKSILMSSIFLIITLILFFGLPEIAIAEEQGQSEDKSYLNIINILKNRDFRLFIYTYGVLTGVIAASVNYGTPILMIKLGAPDAFIGLIPIFMIVFEVILLPFIEKLNFYNNINYVFKLIGVLLIIRWIILGVANSYITIMILALMHGLINGLLLPMQNKLIWTLVPKDQHSTAFIMTNLFCNTIFPAVINLITGILVKYLSIHTYGLVYLFITIISMIIILKKKFSVT